MEMGGERRRREEKVEKEGVETGVDGEETEDEGLEVKVKRTRGRRRWRRVENDVEERRRWRRRMWRREWMDEETEEEVEENVEVEVDAGGRRSKRGDRGECGSKSG